MLTLTGLLLLLVLRPRVKSLVELVVVTRPSVGGEAGVWEADRK